MLGKQLLEPYYLTILGGALLFECLSRLLIAAQHFLHALHHLGKAGYLITGPLQVVSHHSNDVSIAPFELVALSDSLLRLMLYLLKASSGQAMILQLHGRLFILYIWSTCAFSLACSSFALSWNRVCLSTLVISLSLFDNAAISCYATINIKGPAHLDLCRRGRMARDTSLLQ